MSRKPVKRLTGGWGGLAAVDEEIRPLVSALNRHGFRTCNSCEGDSYLTAEVSFGGLKPSITTKEEKEIVSIVRRHTDTPFHFVRRKGKVIGIAFRGNLRGEIPKQVEGRDSILLADSEGFGTNQEYITDKDISKVLFKDSSFWENK